MKAALFVAGRIVVGDSHLAAFQSLEDSEKDTDLVSGFYDNSTGEFVSDLEHDHFFDKQLFLVRHGEVSNHNEADPEISAEGISQAKRAAQCLTEQNVSDFTALTSPLLRCLRTAAILQDILGIQFRIVPALLETPTLSNCEVFKLRNRSEAFPQFEWSSSREWHVLPETHEDFRDRVLGTLRHLPSKSIVVTHCGLICYMAKFALCEQKANPLLEQGIPPASVTYINKQAVQRL